MYNTIDAKTLKKMFLAGTKNLESKKEWINELNVFPVPDGDTGTNMTLTLMAAVSELKKLGDEATLEEVGKKIASGTLKGARGNSGVIMSQLCRGFVKELEGKEELDVSLFVAAFDRAQVTAYKAVMKPKEGTILTVAKGIAQKAAELGTMEGIGLNDFFCDVNKHAEEVLAATPDMLPVLKEAGVVDSGGQGLLEFIKGAYDAYTGKDVDVDFPETGSSAPAKAQAHISAGTGRIRKQDASAGKNKRVDTSNIETSDIKFGYCTEYIVNIEKKFTARDDQAFRKYLSMIGDSLVYVSMDGIVKVHVHTNDPGLAIQKGLAYGSLSSIKIDNMREEHNEKLFAEQNAAPAKEEADAADAVMDASFEEIPEVPEETGAQEKAAVDLSEEKTEALEDEEFLPEEEAAEAASAEEPVNEMTETITEEAGEELPQEEAGIPVKPSAAVPKKEYGFVAVCSGEGLKNVFLNMSVDEVIEGGQTMNPSTEDILCVIDKINAENIFVLPNNGNIIMAAQQAMHLCEDKNVIVIPTKTVAEGITAVINYVPAMTIEENAEHMTEAIGEVKTAEITYSVRDTVINEQSISTGDFMGISGGNLLAVGSEPAEVAYQSVEKLFDDESEIITVYYGMDSSESEARALAERLEEEFDDAEVDLVYGGQPIYHYIVSVE